MTPELLGQLERLAALNIEILPTTEIPSHFVLTRGEAVVLVERRAEGFGAIGSPGALSEKGGFAALVERQGRPFFIAKGEEREASEAEAAQVRQLYQDLKEALR